MEQEDFSHDICPIIKWVVLAVLLTGSIFIAGILLGHL